MMPYGPASWGWGWMVGGWIMMLVFWALVIAGVIFLVRSLSHRGAFGLSNSDDAIAILRRRYAAGEITADQFEEMKRTLERGQAT